MVHVGDEDAHQRFALDLIVHLVGAGVKAVPHLAPLAGALQMVGDGLFGRLGHTGLGGGAAAGGAAVHPPVIEHLGDVIDLGVVQPVGQAQEQVVVLAAVALAALTPASKYRLRLKAERWQM